MSSKHFQKLVLRHFTANGPSNLCRFQHCFFSLSAIRTGQKSEEVTFKPRKALVLAKVSRYEFERRRYRGLNDDELDMTLRKRGSDPDLMRKHHLEHEQNQNILTSYLQEKGLETRVVQRYNFSDECVDWADIVFSAGGDGTFLMAASKVVKNTKPVVGINTDPTRSSGYLCLPSKYNGEQIKSAIDKLLSGSFSWFMRKRLRITLIGDNDKIWDPPIELYNQKLKYPEYRYVELANEHDIENLNNDHPLREDYLAVGVIDRISLGRRVLPMLALNEVFLGESLSSRVSYLEIKLNGEDRFIKTRNSGLCIATGTGSTSWTFNISKLMPQSVANIIEIMSEMAPGTSKHALETMLKDGISVSQITKQFNDGLVFAPDEPRMAYTLRDPVQIGPQPASMEEAPRGFAKKMEVKSRCFDACLVIDGSLSFKFNDGTKAIIEMCDEDALRTVLMD